MKNERKIFLLIGICLSMSISLGAQSILKSNYFNKASYSVEANMTRFGNNPSKKFISHTNSMIGLNAEANIFHYVNIGAGLELSDSVTNHRIQLGITGPLYYWKWGDASLHFDMVKNFSQVPILFDEVKNSFNYWSQDAYVKVRTPFLSISAGYRHAPKQVYQEINKRGFYMQTALQLSKVTDKPFKFEFQRLNSLKDMQRAYVISDGPSIDPPTRTYPNTSGKDPHTRITVMGEGTCFVITDDGYAVTNHHVVEGGVNHQVWINGSYQDAKVVAVDVHNDLAIIKVQDYEKKKVPYVIKKGSARLGEDVSLFGYPLGNALGKDIKLTRGVVSSERGIAGDEGKFQIDAATNTGNSGGPALNSKGEIIGVLASLVEDVNGVAYCITTEHLWNIIEEAGIKKKVVSNRSNLESKDLMDQARAIRSFVLYIRTDRTN